MCQLLTITSKSRYFNFYHFLLQKYQVTSKTHQMTIFFTPELCDLLLHNAEMYHENTYGMRRIQHACREYFDRQFLRYEAKSYRASIAKLLSF